MSASRGYASFHALIILVFAAMAGGWLLRSVSKDAGTAGSYLHMRGAAHSAHAGLAHGLSQLEGDTALALAILDNYRADPSRKWLLGASGATSTANVVSLPGDQKYSTRILGFDPASGLIKLEGQGEATSGSASRATAYYRLPALEVPHSVPPVDHALFVAGDGRFSDAALIVAGPTYFGGGIHIDESGSVFDGDFKSGAYGSNPLRLDGSATFRGKAYFETPVRFESGTAVFEKDVGFDDDAQLDAAPRLAGTDLKARMNGVFRGAFQLDLGGNAYEHSGPAGTARVRNASKVVDARDMLDIPRAMGFNYGVERPFVADYGAISAGASHDVTEFAYVGATFTARSLIQIFHDIPSTDRTGYHNLYARINLNKDLSLVAGDADALPDFVDFGAPHDDDDMYKWLIIRVTRRLDMNGNLWRTTIPGYGGNRNKPGNVMFVVESGGSIEDFGGRYPFRGIVYVRSGGSVTYNWQAGGSLRGAVIHADPNTGFRVDGSTAMRVTLDQAMIDEFAQIAGFITRPSYTPPGTDPELTDARIRPKLLGLF